MAYTRPHNSVLGKIMQPTACVDPCVGVRIIVYNTAYCIGIWATPTLDLIFFWWQKRRCTDS